MKEKPKNCRLKTVMIGLCAVAIIFGLTPGSVLAHEADPHPHEEGSKTIPSTVPPDDVCREPLKGPCRMGHNRPEHGSLANIGNKLANPLADIWQLSMSFNAPAFYDGDVNTGNPRVGGDMALQPVLPIPLYGTGADQWRMITRPIIPFVFGQPIPRGSNDFASQGGIGDIQLPLLVNLPESKSGKWLFGAGPVTLWPTATTDNLGSNQFALGPAMVLGYKPTKEMIFGIFPNYFWKIGSSSQKNNQPNVNQGSLLYFFNYMLGDAWQIGMNPTITFNKAASAGNKWTVPVGLYVGKTIKIGKIPVNIKVGGEYSVVSPNDFGRRFQFRFQITPVIPGFIKNPIFGGK